LLPAFETLDARRAIEPGCSSTSWRRLKRDRAALRAACRRMEEFIIMLVRIDNPGD
jgi:hypothetical protein